MVQWSDHRGNCCNCHLRKTRKGSEVKKSEILNFLQDHLCRQAGKQTKKLIGAILSLPPFSYPFNLNQVWKFRIKATKEITNMVNSRDKN